MDISNLRIIDKMIIDYNWNILCSMKKNVETFST